jgi:hypothetical protein
MLAMAFLLDGSSLEKFKRIKVVKAEEAEPAFLLLARQPRKRLSGRHSVKETRIAWNGWFSVLH